MKVVILIYLEKLHRYVFDNLYVQSYKLRFRDKFTLILYRFLCKRYPNWRKELKEADLIIPSLDGASPATFRKINRPHKSITFKRVVDGLIKLRKEFKGKIWLEVMLIKGINDNVSEARKLKELIERIKPDKVQLNLPIRPAPEKISVPSFKSVSRIKKIINRKIEAVSASKDKKQNRTYKDADKQIVKYLKRRPANLDDLMKSLGLNCSEIIKHLADLLDEGKIKSSVHGKKRYFAAND